MSILEFGSGVLIGLGLLLWQRSRFNARLKLMLRRLQPDKVEYGPALTPQILVAIAHQQQSRQQLEQQLETCKQLLHLAPIGYLQVDDEDQLIWCNFQARVLLGITQETPAAKPRLLLELVRSYELDDLIEQTRHTGKPQQSNWMFHPVSADPSALSEQQGYPLRGYGVPLSENQIGIFLENRQEVAALIQQRDRWTSDLAHELKTPLTSIRLVAETLQTRVDPVLRTWIDRLINETIRLSTLVQDLLDLSKIDRMAFQSLQLTPTDLVELIRSVCQSLEPLARKKQLQFDYRGPDYLLMPLDGARIHRLLVNLLDNSIKYSPAGRAIQIRLSLDPPSCALEPGATGSCQQVHLEVIDSGAGFPEKALPYVFERFYRADPSRSRIATLEGVPDLSDSDESAAAGDRQELAEGPPQGGSGLGLAIARQIVDAHQGAISASNHPDTGGAWLQVRLPLACLDSSSAGNSL